MGKLEANLQSCCHLVSDHDLTDPVFQGAALGYELLANVFAHLDILETEYFGLQYTDEKSVTRWIDQHKSIKKQTCKQRGQNTVWQSSVG